MKKSGPNTPRFGGPPPRMGWGPGIALAVAAIAVAIVVIFMLQMTAH
jgi:hypothetical protein